MVQRIPGEHGIDQLAVVLVVQQPGDHTGEIVDSLGGAASRRTVSITGEIPRQ